MNLLYAILGAIGILSATSCDSRPKATFQSRQRVVGTSYETQIKSVYLTKYFPSTNEVQIFEGTIGEFTGTVTGSMTSSNSAGCHLKFISDGSMRSGGSVRNTQHVDVPFPRTKKLVMPELGEVTVWFLSDEEQRLNAGMFGK